MNEASKQVKYVKNPMRGKTAPFKPYVPNWKERGIEPTDGFTDRPVSQATNNTALSQRRPFVAKVIHKKPEVVSNKIPYAEVGQDIKIITTSPNVGSDNEWFEDFSVVEGQSNLQLDQDQEMIDNNEIVSYASSTLPFVQRPTNIQLEYAGQPIQLPTEESVQEEVIEIVESSFANVESGQYILMIDDQTISIGEMAEVEAEVSALIFGEHPLFQDQAITTDRIVVLKRVPIKVGVFLE